MIVTEDFCLTEAYEGPKFGFGGEIVINSGILPRIHPPRWGNERGGKENRWYELG